MFANLQTNPPADHPSSGLDCYNELLGAREWQRAYDVDNAIRVTGRSKTTGIL